MLVCSRTLYKRCATCTNGGHPQESEAALARDKAWCVAQVDEEKRACAARMEEVGGCIMHTLHSPVACCVVHRTDATA